MDGYGSLRSASASLCTNYLGVILNAIEKYAAADPTQYAAGVRVFVRMLEFLCQSASYQGCQGMSTDAVHAACTHGHHCFFGSCGLWSDISRALIVAGRHLSDPFERAMCTILEYRGTTVGDVMRFCNAFTLREDEVASLMGLFQVGAVTKVRYGIDDVIALQEKMLLPNATRRVMPVGLDLLAAYLGRIMPAAGLAEHSMLRSSAHICNAKVSLTAGRCCCCCCCCCCGTCRRCIQATDRHGRHRSAANHNSQRVSDAGCLCCALHDGRQTCRAERDSRCTRISARTQVH
jgi:hypothetical protein